ncbi:MAG: hypothetical protein WCA82_12125 [Jiangellales bacterium]|jgi:hypothetical protein
MGLVLIGVAGILLGGLISFRRQGKPLGIQVVLGVAMVIALVLATQTAPFA